MNFDWINFLLNNKQYKDVNKSNVIDLMNYHYKVDNIYNDIIFVDVDVDDIDVQRGHIVKLLNDDYIITHIEFLPHNKEFKHRLTLTIKNN